MTKWKLLVSVLFAVLVTACATPKKPTFDEKAERLDYSQNSYFILSVEIHNAVKPKHQPTTQLMLQVEKPGAESKEDRFNFTMDDSDFVIDERDGRVTVHYSGALPPGEYVLKQIMGHANRFPLLGGFTVPMEQSFSLARNEIAYLGKLTATTRERKEGEYRAGSTFPLLDQTITGYGITTFEINIIDDLEALMPELRSRYPALANETVSKRLLPPFDCSRFDKLAETAENSQGQAAQ